MKKRVLLILILGVGITGILLTNSPANVQTESEFIQDDVEIVINQLNRVNGLVPVGLECRTVEPTPPDTNNNFSCILKNNTGKNARAVFVIASLTNLRNGAETKSTRTELIETFVHPDLYDPTKSIRANSNTLFTIFTTSSRNPESKLTIKRLEIEIDYVDFEDNTVLGRNKKGASVVAELRNGADVYHRWQKRSAFGRLKSKNEKEAFLKKTLPNELRLTRRQAKGAKAYRIRLLQRQLF